LEEDSSSLRELSFGSLSTSRILPYSYVGQVRHGAGAFSGFIFKPRVVASAAQGVFDEMTLTQIPGIQWMFQRDREVHEPVPLVPRGVYVFGGCADQRLTEHTQGAPSLASQNLNAAALYFPADAGRGGYSEFLATDLSQRPLASGATLKILSGFPDIAGTSSFNFGKMHATRARSTALGQLSGPSSPPRRSAVRIAC
jgi:hypothetical protein